MNAIILAAGLGSRFKEVTKTKHKALLPIGDVPNIERNIQYLQAFGIKEIYIVVGYLCKQFEYLKEKYEGVKWDNIPVALLEQLDVTTHEIENKWVDEMDTVKNYKCILEKYTKNYKGNRVNIRITLD